MNRTRFPLAATIDHISPADCEEYCEAAAAIAKTTSLRRGWRSGRLDLMAPVRIAQKEATAHKANRRLPVDFKALIRRLTIGGHGRQQMIPLASALLPFPGQMRKEGLLESASPPDRLSSSSRITILGSSSRCCPEVIVIPCGENGGALQSGHRTPCRCSIASPGRCPRNSGKRSC
jgi:hypothetical protein